MRRRRGSDGHPRTPGITYPLFLRSCPGRFVNGGKKNSDTHSFGSEPFWDLSAPCALRARGMSLSLPRPVSLWGETGAPRCGRHGCDNDSDVTFIILT